ncbi:MAG TPA: hypothetical protein ENK23_08210, partial [Sorangium sp.]|nr:hypothetical protein [Sorangium sp.]
EVEQWVDKEFAVALPTVIYGTWGEAMKAAQVTAKSSNFGFFQNISVRAGGPLIMHQVAKRILKRRGKTDGHAWVQQTLDQFDEWIADQPYVAGEELTLGDVAMHGAVRCVRDFPIFETIMARPRTAKWYRRVEQRRDATMRLN